MNIYNGHFQLLCVSFSSADWSLHPDSDMAVVPLSLHHLPGKLLGCSPGLLFADDKISSCLLGLRPSLGFKMKCLIPFRVATLCPLCEIVEGSDVSATICSVLALSPDLGCTASCFMHECHSNFARWKLTDSPNWPRKAVKCKMEIYTESKLRKIE